jgi:nitroimidazol reductase NimA-like FMN-containing flavoprotein (pyridoxamine 5'-phosphate oxidase superfamily)
LSIFATFLEKNLNFSKEGEGYIVPFNIGYRDASIISIAMDDDGNIYIAGEYYFR